jgi:ribosomal protein S18 acetylase RimI-like enzyme
MRVLHLEVARDNEAAKALYRRFGFADRAHYLMTRIAYGENVNQ